MAAFAPCLTNYGFERVGMLWDLYDQAVPQKPAVYALVAGSKLLVSDYWYMETKRDESGEWASSDWLQKTLLDKATAIVPLEVFYIGSARHDLGKRIANYKSQSKKGWPSRLSQKEFTAKRHYATSLLRMARAQRVPVDLYILTVPSEPVYVGRAPVDLLHGWENGLIRELRPRGNRSR